MQYHSNDQTQSRTGQSSPLSCVVGGCGPLTRDAASAKVNNAICTIDGFAKVVICEFPSHASMMAAVRNQKAILSMEGLWMSPDRPLEDRLKYQRLYKVKRGSLEAPKRLGDDIVVDKPLNKIFAVSGDNLVEIFHVPLAGEITWSDSIQPHVRAHVAQVLKE